MRKSPWISAFALGRTAGRRARASSAHSTPAPLTERIEQAPVRPRPAASPARVGHRHESERAHRRGDPVEGGEIPPSQARQPSRPNAPHLGIAHETKPARLARSPRHQVERTADHFRVGTANPRLGNRDAGPVRHLQDCELLERSQLTGKTDWADVRKTRAWVPPRGPPSSPPRQRILLDCAAGQSLETVDLDSVRPERCRKPGGQSLRAQLHRKKAASSFNSSWATTMRCTSEAPSTSRAWRA